MRWARPSMAPREVKLRQARTAYMSSGPSQEAEQVDWTSMTEEQQQTRIEEMRSGVACKRAKVVSFYPNTDGSFLESEAYSQPRGDAGEGDASSAPSLLTGGDGERPSVNDQAAAGSSWRVHDENAQAGVAGAGSHDAAHVAAQAYYAWWYASSGQAQHQQQWGQEWEEGEPAPPGDDAYLLIGVEGARVIDRDAGCLQPLVVDQDPVRTFGSLFADYGSSSDDE